MKIKVLEKRKSQGNHTEFSKTENSSIKFNPIYLENQVKSERKEEDRIEEMEQYRKRIQQNISYDRLIQDNPRTKKTIDGLIELMLEVVCSKRSCIRLNQEEKPKEIVKSRFLKLENEHIHYVLDCLQKNTTKIGNIKAYLLSCLYNSVDTIEQYYSSRVQHDWGSSVWCGS